MGVAYHHAGITLEERAALEEAFKAGTLLVGWMKGRSCGFGRGLISSNFTLSARMRRDRSIILQKPRCVDSLSCRACPWGTSRLEEEKGANRHSYSGSPFLQVVVATSTLAAGVNLPAKRVIIRSRKQGKGVITPATYHQVCPG
jgi:Lhr-like helicase